MITDKLGDITLYNADCMDILRELPDNAFSLAVVDPPYSDANFQNPPQQVMSRVGGGGSNATNDRWNRFGGRFNRYKKALPNPSTHGTVREIQPQITPPQRKQFKNRHLVGYCAFGRVFQGVVQGQ